ncbi:hypothetical protein BC831DRAFT_400492 [Entophlyctis helioformis]|nr:hypothetical protein BC831DRAFT_400492 [Entophlyctis helioformis]
MATATTLDELRLLADMSSRGACPRCSGFGFIHTSVEKHDRPGTLRCKRCIDCKVCDGSGVTIGVVGCKRCNARGFIHSARAAQPHTLPEQTKCFDCEECKDCKGECVLDPKRLQELKKHRDHQQSTQPASGLSSGGIGSSGGGTTVVQITNRNTLFSLSPNVLTLPPMVPDLPHLSDANAQTRWSVQPALIHPHMMGVLGVPIDETIYAAMLSVTAASVPVGDAAHPYKRKTLVSTDETAGPCPRCDGAGFRHDSSVKHDRKKGEKCKNCTACKVCNATGKVVGKRACPTCDTKGFVHGSTERDHDAPQHLRCFFCKDCATCRGSGLISVSTSSASPSPSRPMLRRPEDRLANARDSLIRPPLAPHP